MQALDKARRVASIIVQLLNVMAAAPPQAGSSLQLSIVQQQEEHSLKI